MKNKTKGVTSLLRRNDESFQALRDIPFVQLKIAGTRGETYSE